MPRATEAEFVYGVPLFFEQLIEALKDCDRANDEMNASAAKHGNEMLRLGFTVAQVVYDYGNLCQAVTEIAFELNAPIALKEFQTLSVCLDDAMAQAVTEYGRLREESVVEDGVIRIEVLADQMQSELTAAILAFSVLKDGKSALDGNVGALLDRSLQRLNDLVDPSLTEGRLEATSKKRDPIKTVKEGKASILIVDRDPHIRELEQYFLHQAGYCVDFERDGNSALERAHESTPDVLITEILVPPLDGLSLCRKLKADHKTRDIAVLIFSILASASSAKDAGADAFLLKPLAEHSLIATVGQLVEARNARIAT